MKENNSFYIHKLKESLSNKQKNNPFYSQRAFAKFLGLHSATLNQVLNKKRSLPVKNINRIATKLDLSPKEHTLFIESVFKEKSLKDQVKINENDDRFIIDESYFKVLSEWEHCAVLTLFDLSDFEFSIEEITKRFSISKSRAEVVTFNLLACNLLKKDADGKISNVHSNIKTTEDIKSVGLKLGHQEVLEIGKSKIENVDLELRDFSAMTIAVDLENLNEAKSIIREFRQKMAKLLDKGNKEEIYQLAIQFYPLSNLENANKKTLLQNKELS